MTETSMFGPTFNPCEGPDKTFELRLDQSVRSLETRLPTGWRPQVLLALGSGLAGVADAIEEAATVPYEAVDHMRRSTAPGHANRFIAGTLEGVRVLCMQGRIHPYDGYAPLEATYPVRIAARLGAVQFIVTNASGAINSSYEPGQVVAIADHVNLTGRNPLVGRNLDSEGPRFPEMSAAYSPRLRTLARTAAALQDYDLDEGVYLGVSGPSFETPAEIRAFRALGADLVGMSTVWEVIVAAHCGMEILGLSMVTNMAAGVTAAPISLEQIAAAEQVGAGRLAGLVRGVLTQL